jgi:hypothetical protein
MSLLLVGCGGDDDTADADAAPTTAVEGTVGSAAADEGFCAAVADYMTLTQESSVFTSETEPDPAEVEAVFAELGQQLDELEAEAPDQLATDVGLFASGTRRFIEAVADAGYDFEALAAEEAFAELTAEFESPAYTEASQRLQAYAQDTCGVSGGT